MKVKMKMKMERGGAGKEIDRCEGSYRKKSSESEEEEEEEEEKEKEKELELELELRRGPWTVEEDFTLINYIAHHGEGRWNSLSRSAGLQRTGKSCRLRWLNYLRPDVRRGNITLEEQLLILELHSRWGNRWSKIAQHLPGRSDNEIKNYWRTRVQKHAKQLKCDVNSKQFKDTMRYLWMPRLLHRIHLQPQLHHPPLPNDHHMCPPDALPNDQHQHQHHYHYQDPPPNHNIITYGGSDQIHHHQPLTTHYFNQDTLHFIDPNTTQSISMDAHAHAHHTSASNNFWNIADDDIFFLHNHL